MLTREQVKEFLKSFLKGASYVETKDKEYSFRFTVLKVDYEKDRFECSVKNSKDKEAVNINDIYLLSLLIDNLYLYFNIVAKLKVTFAMGASEIIVILDIGSEKSDESVRMFEGPAEVQIERQKRFLQDATGKAQYHLNALGETVTRIKQHTNIMLPITGEVIEL